MERESQTETPASADHPAHAVTLPALTLLLQHRQQTETPASADHPAHAVTLPVLTLLQQYQQHQHYDRQTVTYRFLEEDFVSRGERYHPQ